MKHKLHTHIYIISALFLVFDCFAFLDVSAESTIKDDIIIPTATVYSSAYFTGKSTDLFDGEYNCCEFDENKVKSLLVNDGYKAVVYSGQDLTGSSWEFGRSIEDLSQLGCDIGSIKIEFIDKWVLYDVNNDKNVNLSDLVRLKKYLAGMDAYINNICADGNNSGRIDVDDIVLLRKSLLNYNENNYKTIAHRGDQIYAPQNMAPAYITAKNYGHTIAENDVDKTADGEYVMWHDTTLVRLGYINHERHLVDINGYYMYTDGTDFYWHDKDVDVLYTFEDGEYVISSKTTSELTKCLGQNYSVQTLPLAVLKRLDFGRWKDNKFAGTQILTFEEWVLLCKRLDIDIYVDRKYVYTDEDIKNIFSIVDRYGMKDRTSWLGIGVGSVLSTLRNLDSNARIGILEHPTQSYIKRFSQYNTGRGFFFNGNGKTMTKEAIELGIKAGFEVEIWYVDFDTSQEETYSIFRKAIEYGVTGITTDHYLVNEAF